MSLKDSLFSDDAEEDLQHFLKNEQRKRVLVFPPVNNYRRFLLHQLVQERFADLQTFSIGQGFARRTVVCYKSDYIGPPKVNGVLSPTSNGFGTKSFSMGIENQCTPNASPEHRIHKAKQVKSAPAYEIYRPPALRRGGPEKSPVNERKSMQSEQTITDAQANTRSNRPKRPDRAVYVPRHRRSVPDDESKNTPVHESAAKPIVKAEIPVIRRPLDSKNTSEPESPASVETTPPASRRSLNRNHFNQAKNSTVESTEDQIAPIEKVINDSKYIDQSVQKKANDCLPVELEDQSTCTESACNFEKRESLSVAVNSIPENSKDNRIFEGAQTTKLDDSAHEELFEEIQQNIDEKKMDHDSSVAALKETVAVQISDNAETISKDEKMYEDNVSSISEKSKSENSSTSLDEPVKGDPQLLINHVIETPTVVSINDGSSCVMDVSNDNETVSQAPKTTSETTNNVEQMDKPVKQTFVSKVLIISTSDDEKKPEVVKPDPAPEITPPEKKKVKKVEKPKSKPAPPPVQNKKINRDECDWDSLFDDNGDCLDPTLIEELTASVGQVVIEKPKSSYKSFTRPVEVSNDEYGHVIEIYNFPSEFKSSDIAAVFSPFKNGGFTLKWVDDTHCLGIFSSPVVAAEVLASDHPFVKTRSLKEATPLSRSKAQKSSEFLQPYRARPKTCAALARRLVTKSLGVKLATAREEREQEKIVLREAKEKRRLANKQRDDVWEGIIAEKSTS